MATATDTHRSMKKRNHVLIRAASLQTSSRCARATLTSMRTWSETPSLCRTAATSMRISPAPVLNSGGRRTAKSLVSSLVPVSPMLSPLWPLSNAKPSEGTGGTIAGTGQFLKSMADDILVVLADPEGSGLYNKVSQVVVPILLVIHTVLETMCRLSTE